MEHCVRLVVNSPRSPPYHRPVTKRDCAYYGVSNQSEVGMAPKDRNLVLTESQAACLMALRQGKDSKAKKSRY